MNWMTTLALCCFVLIVSLFRFAFSERINKSLFCLTTVGSAIALCLLFGDERMVWLLYVPVLLSAYSFYLPGGIAAGVLCGGVAVWEEPNGYGILFACSFAAAGVLSGALLRELNVKRKRNHIWNEQLYKQSKHMNIMKEIGLAIQSTMELDKLLHIILTAITAGFGLGFNRALLLLVPHGERCLKGKSGIGSMDVDKALKIWSDVVSVRMNLSDYIEHQEMARAQDHDLIDVLRKVEIPLDHTDSPIHRALREQVPQIVQAAEGDGGSVQAMLAARFGMTEFGVVPMLVNGEEVGVLIIDNNVKRKPIEIDDLDNLLPLAAQASIAIKNAQLYEETRKLAQTDGLTGLYNQRHFQQLLQMYFDEAVANGSPLSLIILDIDYFKAYNDTNGHLEGNQVLVRLGDLIRESVDARHISSRFGGEEFVIILPDASLEEALPTAQKLRSAVETAAFFNEQAQPNGRLTASIGLSSLRPGMTAESLIHSADLALYAAKHNGRNQVRTMEEEKPG